jgi:hypothetical protein
MGQHYGQLSKQILGHYEREHGFIYWFKEWFNEEEVEGKKYEEDQTEVEEKVQQVPLKIPRK